MVRQCVPGFDSAPRRSSFRRRTLAILVGLSLTLIAVDLALSLGFLQWTALRHAIRLNHAPADPSAMTRSIKSPSPVVGRRLAAASAMLAAGDLHGAQHEYLTILVSFAPDSARAWQGLVALYRRWAAANPAELRRQTSAYRLAIKNGTEMNEQYSPQALEVLAKATVLATREIEDTKTRAEVGATLAMPGEPAGTVRSSRAGLVAPVQTRWRRIAGYVISVGEFASPAMADRMMHLIRSKGYIVIVARRGPVLQVVTRPYRTRRQAEYAVHGLEGLGLSANLMAQRLPSQ